MFSPSPAAVLIDGLNVIGIHFAVDKRQAPTTLDLLEHQQFAQYGFTHAGLAQDKSVSHQVFIWNVNRATRVRRIAHQHPIRPDQVGCRPDIDLGIKE
ncbi:hypothetical protein D3C75_1216780 [compost metagenome]